MAVRPTKKQEDENSGGDEWKQEPPNFLVRYHAELRQHLFSPLSAGNWPVQAQRLLPKRRTEIILEDGEQEVVEDDWNDPKVSQKNVSAEFGGQKWFGRTIFELKPEGSMRRWEAEDAENREAGDSEGNMEAEESEEFKRSRAAAEPTRRQREEHLEQNHAVYKPWCEICVQSRGLGTQHRRRKRKQAAEDAEEAIKTCSQERKSFYRDLSLQSGLAVPTAAYPPGIVTSMLAALKRQMVEDGTLSELDIKYGGPVPSQPLFNPDEDCLQEDYEKFWDNISGEELPKELVQKARQEEVEWIRSIQLYDKVPRAEALQKNITPLKIRWVEVNKGDRASYNVRSRLVGKELKAKTKGSLLAHELFSAMPPWEMVKSLLSLLVTDGFSSESQVLGVFDISRAHFMVPASRELYVEIPEEDREEGEGDTVGRLNRSMYGFRNASHNWMEDWQALLKEEGYEIGVLSTETISMSLAHNLL